MKKALSKLRYTESPAIIDEEAYDTLFEACKDEPIPTNSRNIPFQLSPQNMSGDDRYDQEDAYVSPEEGSGTSGCVGAIGGIEDERFDNDEEAGDNLTPELARQRRTCIKWSAVDHAAPQICG